MPVPDPLLDLAGQLGDAYRAAEAEILEALRVALADPTRLPPARPGDTPRPGGSNRASARKVRRLREVLAEVRQHQRQLDAEARAWVNTNMPGIYEAGAVAGAARLGRGFTWTQLHVDALGALAQDTFADCLEATRYMDRDVKSLIRATNAERVRAKVITGDPAKTAARKLERDLLRRGVSAVTYRDGRNVRPSTYAEMVVRTKTAVAYSVGTLNAYAEDGVRFVEILDGADCGLTAHDSGTPANGLVVTLEVAGLYPIAHPNCRRDFAARPELATAAEAIDAESIRPDAQRYDQARSEYLRYMAGPQADAAARAAADRSRSSRSAAEAGRQRREAQRQARLTRNR